MEIYISFSEKVCANCIHFSQYYTKNKRTEDYTPLNKGKCLATAVEKGVTPLKRGCKTFITQMQKLMDNYEKERKNLEESNVRNLYRH